mmetsp:Transcript_38342/g.90938  ORF Transcript_38342/g.90938 Transcript_38342/m.90938 type:complete len:402 (+) Transcript_38342:833-2038(+)
MAHARGPRAGAFCAADAAAARRADQPPRPRGVRVARGVPEELRQVPHHHLAQRGLPQRRLHAHHMAHPAEAALLHRQLQHLQEDGRRERHHPAEEVREGAGGHQAHQAVHRLVRDLLQPREAGQVEAEDPGQDVRARPHPSCEAREELQVLLPGLREAAAPRDALHERQLLVQREEGGLLVREPEPRHRLRLAGGARGPQRRGQVDSPQAHDRRAHADGGDHQPAHAPLHREVPSALGRCPQAGDDDARVLPAHVPEQREVFAGRRGVARVYRALWHHREDADLEDRPPERGPEEPNRLCDDLHVDPEPPPPRRAHEPSRHRGHRCPRRRHQELQRGARPRQPRLPPHRPGRQRDLGVRQENGAEMERRHPRLQEASVGKAPQGHREDERQGQDVRSLLLA